MRSSTLFYQNILNKKKKIKIKIKLYKNLKEVVVKLKVYKVL